MYPRIIARYKYKPEWWTVGGERKLINTHVLVESNGYRQFSQRGFFQRDDGSIPKGTMIAVRTGVESVEYREADEIEVQPEQMALGL